MWPRLPHIPVHPAQQNTPQTNGSSGSSTYNGQAFPSGYNGHNQWMAPVHNGNSFVHPYNSYNFNPLPPTNTAVKKPKRIRTAFTTSQLLAFEEEYKRNRYIEPMRRKQLASSLGLCDRGIKIWFQNRRMKEKNMEVSENKITSSQFYGNSAPNMSVAMPDIPQPVINVLYGQEHVINPQAPPDYPENEKNMMDCYFNNMDMYSTHQPMALEPAVNDMVVQIEPIKQLLPEVPISSDYTQCSAYAPVCSSKIQIEPIKQLLPEVPISSDYTQCSAYAPVCSSIVQIEPIKQLLPEVPISSDYTQCSAYASVCGSKVQIEPIKQLLPEVPISSDYTQPSAYAPVCGSKVQIEPIKQLLPEVPISSDYTQPSAYAPVCGSKVQIEPIKQLLPEVPISSDCTQPSAYAPVCGSKVQIEPTKSLEPSLPIIPTSSDFTNTQSMYATVYTSNNITHDLQELPPTQQHEQGEQSMDLAEESPTTGLFFLKEFDFQDNLLIE